MARAQEAISGIWIPLVTPFLDGRVDCASLERLVGHYVEQRVSGLLPLGTTGESPTLDDDEAELVVERTLAAADGRVPVYVGIGGNATRKVVRQVERMARHRFDGILSVCPYYNRPGQDGLVAHFRQVASATDRPMLVYNVPHRTSVNLGNDALLSLAEVPNIVGVKDSTGVPAQSLDFLARRPPGFAVLAGEDAHFLAMLAHGADGGVLASAHVATSSFVAVAARMAANDHAGARAIWSGLSAGVGLLFREANPMPVKHCLWRQGLIASPECRLPLTRISDNLARALDGWMDTMPRSPAHG
ncbi:MAG: 4-hydroxy-tetrahydrodipicolinate synthase [Alphaproteobacteria bacterium]|nr:4-hydroxy-tetrahydrodipicolinate synthase [Alphaproteobacteria bacterium]